MKVNRNKIMVGAAAGVMIFLTGCADSPAPSWAAVGGSRADGTVRMAYEYGEFQTPNSDNFAAQQLAAQRCAAWGYSGAQAFGGQTRQCVAQGGVFSMCARQRVEQEYQCVTN